MEIIDFKSQKAYLTINSKSEVIFLHDQVVTIKDILTQQMLGSNRGPLPKLSSKRRKNFHVAPRFI